MNSGDALYPDRADCDVVDETLMEVASNASGSASSPAPPASRAVAASCAPTVATGVLSDSGVSSSVGDEAGIEAALNAMSDAIITFDTRQRVKWMNAAGRSLLQLEEPASGHTAADLLARMQLRDLNARVVDAERSPLARALWSGESTPGADLRELVMWTDRDGKRYVRVSSAPIRDGEGTIVGAVVVVRDVSACHRSQEQRAQIVRSVAHDLGNPLSSVSLYVQTQLRQLQQGKLPPKPDLNLLQTMEHALERADHLVKDLQAAARIESDQVDYHITCCDLSSLCRRELDLWRLLTSRDVVLVAPNQPIEVLADRDRICQALSNLLSNAHKYSALGQPIKVLLRRTRNGEHVRLAVQDAGPGIPKHERQAIWEPFHRAEGIEIQCPLGAAGAMGGNMGLGLSITKAIIERHGGTVGVTTSLGRGSTFFLTLPLAAPHRPSAPKNRPRSRRESPLQNPTYGPCRASNGATTLSTDRYSLLPRGENRCKLPGAGTLCACVEPMQYWVAP
jgi:two-component system phosphate regulon sensor histidine kinase PhoR